MTRLRLAAFALTLAGIVGVALVGRSAPDSTGGKMKVAADTFLASLTAEQKHSVDSSAEMERLADELPIEQVAKRWIVVSDPEEALAQIRPYVDAGLRHLVFHGPGDDNARFLQQFSEDVLPLLRSLAP